MSDSNASSKKPKKPSGPVDPNAPSLGWTIYAEQINGRFAMVGIVVLIVLELLTGQDVISWLGLR